VSTGILAVCTGLEPVVFRVTGGCFHQLN